MAAEAQSGDAVVTSAAAESGGRVPDFFIVGHPKCGTTVMYEMLKRHPQIHMPAKEPRFFAMGRIDMEAGGSSRSGTEQPAADPRRTSAWRPHTLDGYMALFAGARPEQRIGEATPAYLRSPLAPGHIMRELRRRFKPEVEALSDNLGRDLLTLWGYDDLA